MGIARLPPDDPTLRTVRRMEANGQLCDGRPKPDVDLALRMYREMRRIRRLDEKLLMRQRQGRAGFYGAITGQEAVPVATALGLEDRDWIFPALREAAIMLVRGFPLSRWIAQVYGNDHDILKGRQMPSHMSGRQVNQVSWSSCIGVQLPQAVGAAMAAKQRGDDVVTVGFLGDGATSTADFHTAMNFAAVYKAPCIILCQNNHWSISVPTAQQTASPTIAMKALAYGMPGVRVDGNDAVAVQEVVAEAARYARSGRGPVFVEAVTYRIGPHSSSDDPTRYRSEEEVEMWRGRDPIARLERWLVSEGALDDASLEELAQSMEREIDEALVEAESHGPPARHTLFEDVFATQPWHLVEQANELDPPEG